MTSASMTPIARRDHHHALEVAVSGHQHADEGLEAVEEADEGGRGAIEHADRHRGDAGHRGGEQDGELADAADIDAEGRRHVRPLGDRARRPSIGGAPHVQADEGQQPEADDEIDDLPQRQCHRADVDEVGAAAALGRRRGQARR